MPDSGSHNAERGLQRSFSFLNIFSYLAILLGVIAFDRWLARLPDREEMGRRVVTIDYRAEATDVSRLNGWHVVGRWAVSATDPRLGGVSALAIDGDQLLFLTDAGAIIHSGFRGTGARAVVGDLPGGPGSPHRKAGRDGEALLSDPEGRGWWVAFENRHQLWLFDGAFRRALRRIDLGGLGFSANTGIEGLAVVDGAIFAFPESGDSIARISGDRVARVRLDNDYGRISEAANLPDGRVLLIARNLGSLGFRNRLLSLEQDGAGYRTRLVAELPFGGLDNAEGLAVQPLPGGGIRLWVVTDNGFRRRVPTRLLALEQAPLR